MVQKSQKQLKIGSKVVVIVVITPNMMDILVIYSSRIVFLAVAWTLSSSNVWRHVPKVKTNN